MLRKGGWVSIKTRIGQLVTNGVAGTMNPTVVDDVGGKNGKTHKDNEKPLKTRRGLVRPRLGGNASYRGGATVWGL